MAPNDLTVSPVTGTCENRRQETHVRENEPPVAARSFVLNGDQTGSWMDSVLANGCGVGATFTNPSALSLLLRRQLQPSSVS
jgi:hypothetical protein